MADTERELEFGFVDKRVIQGNANYAATSMNTGTNFNSVANLRARLAVVNAAYFTSARLDNMTKNDMVYALRIADEPTGI